jgi:hypothetical protein
MSGIIPKHPSVAIITTLVLLMLTVASLGFISLNINLMCLMFFLQFQAYIERLHKHKIISVNMIGVVSTTTLMPFPET